ncbi:hypothetical protein VTJ04DRAFT_8017 [Mycothermus thermophilus]|uniref:uncharacterized protein n=1 Tax=Humicola insolens TaxID=85995 RepID=UPI0037427D9E
MQPASSIHTVSRLFNSYSHSFPLRKTHIAFHLTVLAIDRSHSAPNPQQSNNVTISNPSSDRQSPDLRLLRPLLPREIGPGRSLRLAHHQPTRKPTQTRSSLAVVGLARSGLLVSLPLRRRQPSG